MKSRIGFDLAIGLSLRGLGAATGFVLFWLIAQIGGAPTVGAYQLGLTTASTLALLAVAGQDVLRMWCAKGLWQICASITSRVAGSLP